MLYPSTVWLDGGGMTGIAWLLNGGHVFQADEYPFDEACFQIEQWCAYGQGTVAIGWERYTIRPGVPQTHAYDAIGINMIAGYLARKHGCAILPVAAQHTPNAADRRELEAIGWWVPGKNDAQSAACHALRYCRRSGNLPPREAAILSDLAGTMQAGKGERHE
jgi:hypothetical protein